MRKYITLAACLLVASPAFAQSSHYVGGYVTKNGTYVAPHYQTNPDSTKLNNWSTQGNVNRTPARSGRSIHTRSSRAMHSRSPLTATSRPLCRAISTAQSSGGIEPSPQSVPS